MHLTQELLTNLQCSSGSRCFAKELRAWRWGMQWPVIRLTMKLKAIIEADPITTTWEVVEELNIDHWVQIANIRWIIEKAREFQKNIYFCFIDYAKPLSVWITINCGKFWKRWEYQTTWPASQETWMQVRKQQLELTWNNRLVPNRKRSSSRLYIVTLLI